MATPRRPSFRPVVALAFLLSTSSALAGDGWTVLFDGRSTSAWRGYNRDSFPAGCWSVEGGTLKTVPSKTPDACDLITRRTYRDFELALEWKVGKGGNSGMLYRAAELPGTPMWHSAPELQILDDTAHPTATPQTLTGSLYDLYAPENKVLRPLGEWNEARVVVKGSHVEHWLNGRKVLEYELGSAALRARVAASKFKDIAPFAREKEGHIGLQHHGEEAWFRNIRVRTLRP